MIQINNYISKLIGYKIITDGLGENISYNQMREKFIDEIAVQTDDYESRFMFTDILYQYMIKKNEN